MFCCGWLLLWDLAGKKLNMPGVWRWPMSWSWARAGTDSCPAADRETAAELKLGWAAGWGSWGAGAVTAGRG